MAKLTDFTTPTGAKGNILDISSWSQMILGSMVLLATFAIGQNFLNKASSKIPIDTQIDPIVKMPSMASSTPAREVY